jgi:hypothetical protein
MKGWAPRLSLKDNISAPAVDAALSGAGTADPPREGSTWYVAQTGIKGISVLIVYTENAEHLRYGSEQRKRIKIERGGGSAPLLFTFTVSIH